MNQEWFNVQIKQWDEILKELTEIKKLLVIINEKW